MRVLRVVAGILTLLLALPVLVAGGVAWWAMQHRSPDGAFHAAVTPIDSPSRVIVVSDVDAVLRRDAPIARAEQTTLRLSTSGFIGIADPDDVAAFVAGANYTVLEGVALGRGDLPTRTRQVNTGGGSLSNPKEQDFWVRAAVGELSWTPAVDRGRQVALVIVAPPGEEQIRINAAVTAGWLNSTTWGLLILGPVLLLLGFAALAWPQRPREIVYVVDNSSFSPPIRGIGAATVSQAPIAPAPSLEQPSVHGAWPPPVPLQQTEPPRDLPMPIAGVHLHLTKRS